MTDAVDFDARQLTASRYVMVDVLDSARVHIGTAIAGTIASGSPAWLVEFVRLVIP